MEPNKIMLSELDAFCCDFSFIRDLDGSPIDDIMMPMMDDSELESILEDIMDMNDDLDTLQQVPTNSLVHNDVIDLSIDECDEDEIPSFDWISSCSDLSFNDPTMNDNAPPRDTIQMMLDTEQYSFKPIDMNDVQNDDGITNKQRDSVAEWIFKVSFFNIQTSSTTFNRALPVNILLTVSFVLCSSFYYRTRSWTSMEVTNNVPFWLCHTWIGSFNGSSFISRTLN
jgi:hypothetical protein